MGGTPRRLWASITRAFIKYFSFVGAGERGGRQSSRSDAGIHLSEADNPETAKLHRARDLSCRSRCSRPRPPPYAELAKRTFVAMKNALSAKGGWFRARGTHAASRVREQLIEITRERAGRLFRSILVVNEGGTCVGFTEFCAKRRTSCTVAPLPGAKRSFACTRGLTATENASRGCFRLAHDSKGWNY